jgi:hypothetical protein
MANSVESFLERFVVESLHDEARESMSELFGELHSLLARDFLKSYSEKKSKEVKETKKEVSKCQAKTAKGENCPRKICADSDEFCAMHLKQSQKSKPEPKNKVVKKEVSKCQAKTAKGENCPRNICADSDEFCATHLKQSQNPKDEKKKKVKSEKKPKAEKKSKKEKKVAEHTHSLSEKIEESVAENCELCQTHGNTLDPELSNEDFEGVSDDMQSRLQEILSNISELDETENEESVAGPCKLQEENDEYDEGETLDMPEIDADLNSDEDEDDDEEEEDDE